MTYRVMFIRDFWTSNGGATTSQIVEFPTEQRAAEAMTQACRDCPSLICVRLYEVGR